MNIKMIKNTENISKEKITLFCLPFAGGGASAYNQWAKKMQGKVTVCPVQLPGREEQIMEKPYIDMSVMLDDLEEAVRKVVYGPYALWGHSMGGKIAYELEKRLEAAGYTAKCLFISGSRVPSIPEPNPIYHLPDEEFKRGDLKGRQRRYWRTRNCWISFCLCCGQILPWMKRIMTRRE